MVINVKYKPDRAVVPVIGTIEEKMMLQLVAVLMDSKSPPVSLKVHGEQSSVVCRVLACQSITAGDGMTMWVPERTHADGRAPCVR